MRGRGVRLSIVPVTAAMVMLGAVGPALAQEDDPSIPTTPVPQPADPGQPSATAPIGPQPTEIVLPV